MTRYVLVVEDTKDMSIRDSWLYLRTAVRKWSGLDLFVNTEAGLVLVNDSSASRLVGMQASTSQAARGLVSSNLPYSPGDSHAPACLACGVREATDMLVERAVLGGPASSVIVLIAPGVENINDLVAAAKAAAVHGIRVTTINYPRVLRSNSLDAAASVTGAPAYTVIEKGHNMINSLVGTYFQLTNALTDITHVFYEGHRNSLPIEVHRRELTDASSVTGTFVLEEGLGAPSRFAIFTHNTENPLLKSVTLISPSQRAFTVRSETLISLKMLTINANINESGTWQYKIERFRGNPQPHYVQVIATPWSPLTPVVRARLFTSTGRGPLVLYAQVTWGGAPVLGALVEVTASRPGVPGMGPNGTTSAAYIEKFMLLDTGGGDPDLTRGDGIYSRYFSTVKGGAGTYTFDVAVSDNGNTAYTWKENREGEHAAIQGVGACCGSVIRQPAVANLAPFQRMLPALTLALPDAATVQARTSPMAMPGRVGDLRGNAIAMEPKARLTWTAPDIGGLIVERYEIKYSTKLSELVDGFETTASTWPHGTPFPLPAGADTSFTLDLSLEPRLLDVPFFVALRAFPETDCGMAPGPMSNWARIFVRSPPPPSTVPTSGASAVTNTPWGLEDDDEEPPVPTEGFDFGWDLILPVGGGLVLLLICLGIYCYMCVVRRSPPRAVKLPHPHAHAHAHEGPGAKTPTGLSPVGSAVGSPTHSHAPLANPEDSPSMEQKKRLSLADPMNIHAQVMHHASQSPQHLSPCMSPLSSPLDGTVAVHTGSLQRPRTLSPYQSWTASQLLHEHERRHSPYGDEQALPAYQYHAQYQHPQHAVDGPAPQYDAQYFHSAPVVPPLPHLRFEEEVYGVQQQPQQQSQHGFLHSNRMLFNPSLQGSLSSVNSHDRKKRNVTMV